MAYPNLVAEMRRPGLTHRALAEVTEKTTDTLTTGLPGNGDLPIGKAFAIQEKFFPDLPISYLFSTKPIQPTTEKMGRA